MDNISRLIETSQIGIHEKLPEIVDKHCVTDYLKPISGHTQQAFEVLSSLLTNIGLDKIILDSGCGTGLSTQKIAKMYPDSFIVGVDRSEHRLGKHDHIDGLDNYTIIRADCIDFWRLLNRSNITVSKHYILYPNPYPKKSQLTQRWQGHPVFSDLLTLSDVIELRTNWEIYALEFEFAIKRISKLDVSVEKFISTDAISLFEKKYSRSDHDLYKVIAARAK